MYKLGLNKYYLKLVILLCHIWLVLAQSSQGTINGGLFKTDLEYIANENLGVNKMQKFLDEEVTFTKQPATASSALSVLSGALTAKFDSRISAVKKLRDSIQSGFSKDLSANRYDYEQCCSATGLEFEPAFNQKVSRKGPCIAGPPSYEGNTGTLVGSWLPTTMKDNALNNPSLRWQYYGTETGMLYNFPSTKNCDKTYDPRYRPWYVSTVTPNAKDMVLIIDKSGSMINQRHGGKTLMEIAQDAAKTVIDTLNPNDRVGVVAFSTDAETPTGSSETSYCYSTSLALATSQNKKYLRQYIGYIRGTGSTYYSKALTRAFELIKNTDTLPNSSGQRDKVILFLTDGFPSDDETVIMNTLRTLNAEQNNKYILLTYGLGSGITSDAVTILTKMTNQVTYDTTKGDITPGKFTRVTDPDDLRSSMASYYDFFSKTSSLDQVSISLPYQDSFGTGLLISVCMQVQNAGRLTGVVCSDVSGDDLFTDVSHFQEGELSYAFMVDNQGRMMMHPLLPLPVSATDEAVIVRMTELERQTEAKDILTQMQNGQGGSKQFSSTRVISEGSAEYGYTLKTVRSTYSWQSISSTGFSVCVVIADGDEITKISSYNKLPKHLNYHRLDLLANTPTCSHFGRLSIKDNSTVKFSAGCFQKPYLYKTSEERKVEVEQYNSYMTGASDYNAHFKDGIRETVAVTAEVDRIWKGTGHSASSRYIATQDGIFRAFPGHLSARDYEPKLRPWYKRALGFKGSITLSTPYLDSKGVGYVVTLSQVLFTGAPNREHNADLSWVFGVMGIDFTLPYFYSLLVARFPVCQTEICFIMDSSAHIVLHKDFVDLTSAVLPPIVKVHITTKEPKIANYLIQNNKMKKLACSDYLDKKDLFHWKIALPAGEKVIASDFELYPVSGSNVFVGINKYDQDNFKDCHCTQGLDKSNWKCLNSQCECPCYLKSSQYSYCTDTYSSNQDSVPPCVPAVRSTNLGSSLTTTEQAIAARKQPCYQYDCKSYKEKATCVGTLACSWCHLDTSGNSITAPFCGNHTTCYLGVTGWTPTNSTDPRDGPGEGDGSVVGIVIGVILACLVVIALVVGGVICYKRMQAGKSPRQPEPAVNYGLDRTPSVPGPPAFGNVEQPPAYHEVFGGAATPSAPTHSTLFPKA